MVTINQHICVSITIEHNKWNDPKNAYISFFSTPVDSMYAEGSQAWGWGGEPKLTDEEYLEQIAIPRTIAYLGGKFKSLYGRDMKKSDICGQSQDCVPRWNCEPGNTGYSSDGCGNRRQDSNCNPLCQPTWVCETPLNGYSSDGCGNRRLDSICNPEILPPVPICTEGATRQVKCPTSGKMVTQQCTGNKWVTIKDGCDEVTTQIKDYTNYIIAVIIIILFIILSRRS